MHSSKKKKEEVTDVTSQESEKPIMVKEKEINDQEKEIEVEKEEVRWRLKIVLAMTNDIFLF